MKRSFARLMAVLMVLDAFFIVLPQYAQAVISDGMNAFDVLGQGGSFTSSTGATSATALRSPTAVAVDTVHHRLFANNNWDPYILVYNLDSNNVLIDRTADFALNAPDPSGPDFGSSYYFDNVDAMAYDPTGNRLFVADSSSAQNRVLVYDVASITNGEAPVNVLGQPDLNTTTFPAGATDGVKMRPRGLAFDDAHDRLFVSDFGATWGGYRVLVFDVASITNGESAVNVLGQTSLTSGRSANAQNPGAGCTTTPNACGFDQPGALAYDDTNQRLFVADDNNSRVEVFDVTSITDGEAAVKVLGQTSFTDGSFHSASQSQFGSLTGLAYDNAHQRLFVGGGSDNRTLMFDVNAITNGENAVNVIGQANFTDTTIATTQSGQKAPAGVAYGQANDVLYVVDGGNNRALLYDAAAGGDVTPPIISGTSSGTPTATGATITWTTDEASTSLVNYGLTGSYGSSSSNGTLVTSHTISLSGLTPFTVYHYQVCSTDAATNQACSSDATFTTAHSNDPTLANKIVLSRLKAGTSATTAIVFTLQNTLNGTLTVTFPAGFTVTAAATGPASSACLSGFGFTSTTLTATKTNCSGTITLGGATVTNPVTPGVYNITWVNDDPGGGQVFIVDDDQVSVTGSVASAMTFNVGSQASATACDGTFSANGGTIGLGSLTTGAVASSDVSSVPHICTRVTTNAGGGAAVTVVSANAALKSISVPADAIPSSTATLTAGTTGYGLCAGSGGGDSGKDTTTPAGATPAAASPFNGSCSTSAHAVGGLTTSPQTVWSFSGPAQNAFFRLFLKAAISPSVPAHSDYADTLTFIATGTY